MINKIEFSDALLEPDEYFSSPQDILSYVDYTSAQKKMLLAQWKNDIHELLVAEEENMPNKFKALNKKKDLTLILAEINLALATL